MTYWLYIAGRTLLFTALEWLVLYDLWKSFPKLRRIPRPLWFVAGALLFIANFAFKPVRWWLYPGPDSSALWSFFYRVYVTSYFLIGVVAMIAGGVLALHYGWEWWQQRRSLKIQEPALEAKPAEQEPPLPAHSPAAPGLTLSRRAFLSWGVAGGLSLTTGVSAWAVATSDDKDVRLRRVLVPVPETHRHLAGLRILQITDIHVGPFLRGDELSRLMELAAAQKADLIVHTGDHYNYEKEYEAEGASPLLALSAPHGLYAVGGNHDRYFGIENFEKVFKTNGFEVLSARSMEVPGVPGLVIHGIRDPEAKWPKRFEEVEALSKHLDPAKFNLLLSHRPEAFMQAADAGFHLTLAGHTHGGQIHFRLPFGIDISPARIVHPYDWGLFGRNRNHLYVSSGLGYAGPPVRTFCPPEIALIELVPPGQGETPRTA